MLAGTNRQHGSNASVSELSRFEKSRDASFFQEIKLFQFVSALPSADCGCAEKPEYPVRSCLIHAVEIQQVPRWVLQFWQIR